MAADVFENTNTNSKLETKVGGQLEDLVLAKDIIIKDHRKLCDNEKETFEKRVNNMKANGGHIVPRL